MRFPLKFVAAGLVAGLLAAVAVADEALPLPSPVPPPAPQPPQTVVSGWWDETPGPASAGWVPPPMFGDAVFGGLRRGSPGGLLTIPVGYAEAGGGLSIELVVPKWANTAERATFTSVNIADPFVSIGRTAGLTTGTVVALQPNAAVLAAVRSRFPGATFVGAQAVPLFLTVKAPPPGLADTVFVNRPTTGLGAGARALLTKADGTLIGPFPGSAPGQNLVVPGGDPSDPYGDVYYVTTTVDLGGMAVGLPEPGGASRYTRVARNNSPLPQTRAILDFDYLSAALNGQGVSQVTFGGEYAFLGGDASVMLLVPVAHTLSNTQFDDRGAAATGGEFGNVSVWLKYVTLRTAALVGSVGFGVNTPTAGSVSLYATPESTTPLLRVRNQSVLVSPYAGWLYAPSRCWFAQGFTQIDLDANGNPVESGGADVGRLRSPALLTTGAGVGFVAFEEPVVGAWVSRIVPMTELHYTTSFGKTRTFATPAGEVSARGNGIETLTVIGGAAVGVGRRGNLNLGVGVPLTGSTDQRQYRWQAVAQLSFAFGGR